MDAPPTRRSLRLTTFDYSTHGAYFVTIVAQNRRTLFGDVSDGSFTPTAAGVMLDEWWQKLPAKFEGAFELDEFIVMPNHVHGIIWLIEPVGAAPCGRPTPCWI